MANRVSQFTFDQIERKLQIVRDDQGADKVLLGDGTYGELPEGGAAYDDTALTGRVSDLETALADKADKTELDGLATETFVAEKINEAKLEGTDVDLSIYEKTADVDAKLELKADKTELDALVDSDELDAALAEYTKTADLPTDAETVNGHTVEADVPSDAVFTDTVYDDTDIKQSIADMDAKIGVKADADAGTASTGIFNYIDTQIAQAQLDGGDVDLSGYATKDDLVLLAKTDDVNTALGAKVDKADGKSLMDDAEIERLAGVDNYDDTAVQEAIEEIEAKIGEPSATEITEHYEACDAADDSALLVVADGAVTDADAEVEVSAVGGAAIEGEYVKLVTETNTVAGSGLYAYVDEAIANADVDLTGYATEAYVGEKIAELVDSAPETLNTLNELATALRDNADVVDAINGAIALKADTTYVDDAVQTVADGIAELEAEIGEPGTVGVEAVEETYIACLETDEGALLVVADDAADIDVLTQIAVTEANAFGGAFAAGDYVKHQAPVEGVEAAESTGVYKAIDAVDARVDEVEADIGVKGFTTVTTYYEKCGSGDEGALYVTDVVVDRLTQVNVNDIGGVAVVGEYVKYVINEEVVTPTGLYKHIEDETAGLATEVYVINKITEAQFNQQDVDLSAYAQTADVDAKIAAIDFPIDGIVFNGEKAEPDENGVIEISNPVRSISIDDVAVDPDENGNVNVDIKSGYATKDEVTVLEAHVGAIDTSAYVTKMGAQDMVDQEALARQEAVAELDTKIGAEGVDGAESTGLYKVIDDKIEEAGIAAGEDNVIESILFNGVPVEVGEDKSVNIEYTAPEYDDTALADRVTAIEEAGYVNAVEVAELVADLNKLSREIRDTVPDPAVDEVDETTIYLVKNEDGVYEQWQLIAGKMELVGSTEIDLTGYATVVKVEEDITALDEKLTGQIATVDERVTTEVETINAALDSKVAALQGAENAGKVWKIDEEGNAALIDPEELYFLPEEISWADYQTLTEEEQNSGKVYFVYDREDPDTLIIDDEVREDKTWSSKKMYDAFRLDKDTDGYQNISIDPAIIDSTQTQAHYVVRNGMCFMSVDLTTTSNYPEGGNEFIVFVNELPEPVFEFYNTLTPEDSTLANGVLTVRTGNGTTNVYARNLVAGKRYFGSFVFPVK